MELVTINNGQIELATAVLVKMKAFNSLKKEIDELDKQVKEELKQAMKENGIKSVDNEYFKATYIPESTRFANDMDEVKNILAALGKGIPQKESKVKDSIRITYRK